MILFSYKRLFDAHYLYFQHDGLIRFLCHVKFFVKSPKVNLNEPRSFIHLDHIHLTFGFHILFLYICYAFDAIKIFLSHRSYNILSCSIFLSKDLQSLIDILYLLDSVDCVVKWKLLQNKHVLYYCFLFCRQIQYYFR